MFSYYDTEIIDNQIVIDVWKNLELDDLLASEDYIFHTLNENENIMDISWKYYNNTTDWWIIYLFNKLYDVNFDILQNPTIGNTQNYYVYNLQNYLDIEPEKQKYLQYVIRRYYMETETLENAVIQTAARLATKASRNDPEFIDSFKVYIYDYLVNRSTYKIQLKVPNSQLVYNIKNRFEQLSVVWKNK